MSNARIHLYNYIQFRTSLNILDDQFLDIVKEDILKYNDNTGNIHSRWSPYHPNIDSDDQHILVYFYWQSDIDPKSVVNCFKNNSRFGKFVKSTSKVMKMCCPTKIPPTELCMKCNNKKCNKIRYGWIVRLNVTPNLCSECQNLSTSTSTISTDNDTKDDDECMNGITDDYAIKEDPDKISFQFQLLMHHYAIKEDADKISFQFQLLMHQAFMKHINPSIRSKEKLKHKVIKTIGKMAKDYGIFHVLPPVFQRSYEKMIYLVWNIKTDPDIKSAIGILNSHSNQLIRDHKARIINNQVKYINFDDHPEIMHRIISLINEGYKSADSWFWHLPEGEDNLIESYFDLMDIMKQLIKYKFKYEMVIDRKFRVKKLPQEIKDNYNWYKAIKSAMILDCDSTYRLWRTKLNSSTAEKDVTFTLDNKGHENQTEDDQRNNPNHNVKDGTPDNLFTKPLCITINGNKQVTGHENQTEDDQRNNPNHNVKDGTPDNLFTKPLCITINGNKQVTLYWIDVKYECCCITTEHRRKLREQTSRYIENYGFGALVFTNGYVEGLNIADGVICMSLTWLKQNIPNINEYTRKPIIGIDKQCDEDTDDDEIVSTYFGDNDGQDDEKYNDDTSCSDDISINNGEESADSEDSKDGIKSMRTKPIIISDDISIDNGEESADSEDSKDGIKSMRTKPIINTRRRSRVTSSFSSFDTIDNRTYVPLPPISNNNSDKYNNNKRLTTKYSSNYGNDGDYYSRYNAEDHSMRLSISEATLKHKIRRHNGTKNNTFETLDESLFTEQF
eukprot:CAMPEP_0201594004 /NCGR_PEP_ID=MMETSP0190_2-20130828/191452_1 /ASSEMBLY_ACC=CAM_ASM_000263 /TAXON_ID=37353 /ORGANISM="Rosalina sp." /LENGTH=785 /DNA_ID=CAMNT_0048053447 /DNA_START=195 /DNA_END=2553 /DNA_ORIENTATION=-